MLDLLVSLWSSFLYNEAEYFVYVAAERLTKSFHHARLPCVRFDGNDALEAVEGHHPEAGSPDVLNVLQLGRGLETSEGLE